MRNRSTWLRDNDAVRSKNSVDDQIDIHGVADERLSRLSAWLCPVDLQAHQGNVHVLQHPQTSTWFTRGAELQTWLHGEQNMLWIYGKRE